MNYGARMLDPQAKESLRMRVAHAVVDDIGEEPDDVAALAGIVFVGVPDHRRCFRTARV